MDMSAERLAAAIGERVKRERKLQNLTLEQLSLSAGLSKRMVINVEQGSVNPSVGTLLRLSNALGIGLPALVEQPQESDVRITKAGSGAILWTGKVGGTGTLLTGTEAADVVELWHWVLLPGESHTSQIHAQGTQELIHVLEGTLLLEIAGEEHSLSAGDAISFASDKAHSYANAGEDKVSFSLAVYEPLSSIRSASGEK